MKILFLHGWHSVPAGLKPTHLKHAGHEVINPQLDDDDQRTSILDHPAISGRRNPMKESFEMLCNQRTKHSLSWLIVIAAVGAAMTVSGRGDWLHAEPPDKPLVVLEGEGDMELAPHGEGNIYAPDVLWDGKFFRMWYGGQGKDGHDRIAYAESKDGKKWVRKGVVLKDDSANHINDPSVVVAKGKYYMYYTRTEKDVVDRIDLAISDDGMKWEPKGDALAAGPDGAWDALSVGRPTVIFHDGLFKMWYDGRKDFPPKAPVKDVPKSDKSQRSVGYATSKEGLKWERHKVNPVFGQDAGAVDVKFVGNGFIMLYESREGTKFARSKDGIEWTDGGIFTPKSGATIDSFGHVTPFLFIGPNKNLLRLFVGAASATTWDHNCIAVFEIDDDGLN